MEHKLWTNYYGFGDDGNIKIEITAMIEDNRAVDWLPDDEKIVDCFRITGFKMDGIAINFDKIKDNDTCCLACDFLDGITGCEELEIYQIIIDSYIENNRQPENNLEVEV